MGCVLVLCAGCVLLLCLFLFVGLVFVVGFGVGCFVVFVVLSLAVQLLFAFDAVGLTFLCGLSVLEELIQDHGTDAVKGVAAVLIDQSQAT